MFGPRVSLYHGLFSRLPDPVFPAESYDSILRSYRCVHNRRSGDGRYMVHVAENDPQKLVPRVECPIMTSIRSVMNSAADWLHAGEGNAMVVYRKRLLLRLLYQAIGMVLVSFFPVLYGNRPIILVVVAIVGFPRQLFEGRRAVIFTPTELIYRPAFGAPRRIPLASIAHLRCRKVVTPFNLQVHPVPGVILTLKNGKVEAVPLDFKERPEIIQRLEALTRSPAELTG